MEHPFFPDPVFAWAFFLVLVAATAAAACVDLRRLVIPKSLTLPTLALGFAFSVARVAWLGAAGHAGRVMLVPVSGPWTGALAGLLFAAIGFLFAFALFFILWILGTCGGGDVKLFAALGAWGGVKLTLFLLMGTIVFVVLLAAARLALGLFTKSPAPAGRRPGRRVLSYSLPVALSVVVVCLYLFRGELLPGSSGGMPLRSDPATSARAGAPLGG